MCPGYYCDYGMLAAATMGSGLGRDHVCIVPVGILAPLAAIELGVSKAFAPFACGAFLLGCTFISATASPQVWGNMADFSSVGSPAYSVVLLAPSEFSSDCAVGQCLPQHSLLAWLKASGSRVALLRLRFASRHIAACTDRRALSGMAAIFAGPPLAILTQELMPALQGKTTRAARTAAAQTAAAQTAAATAAEL